MLSENSRPALEMVCSVMKRRNDSKCFFFFFSETKPTFAVLSENLGLSSQGDLLFGQNRAQVVLKKRPMKKCFAQNRHR